MQEIWTKAELALLRKYSEEEIDKVELIEALPDRTWNAIRQKLHSIQKLPAPDSKDAKAIFTMYLDGKSNEEIADVYEIEVDLVAGIIREKLKGVHESISNYAEANGLGSYHKDRHFVKYFLDNYNNNKEVLNNKFAPKERQAFGKRWSKEENEFLLSELESGKHPVEIHIKGRSYKAILAHVSKAGQDISRASRPWTVEEEILLRQGNPVPGRSERACRHRLKSLDDSAEYVEWTEEEEAELLEKYLSGLSFAECKPERFSLKETEAKAMELKEWAMQNYRAQHKGFVTLDKLRDFLYG